LRLSVLVLAAIAGFAAAPTAAQAVNAIAFENGAVLTSYTSEYGGGASSQWIALALIDGDPATGWASANGQPTGQEFVFELPAPHAISGLAFDTTFVEESGYPGIGAKAVEVWAAEALDGSYRQIWSGELATSAETQVELPEPQTAARIKLVIAGNGGDASYTELMEFAAFGEPLTAPSTAEIIEGTYQTNWGPFYVILSDGRVKGCYDHDQGRFSGSSSGNLLNLVWRESNDQVGRAVMAVTRDGGFLNGFWYEGGARKGTWFGPFDPDAAKPNCAADLVETDKSEVAQSLDETGRATLYGIYFDTDSDVIRPDSLPTLNNLFDWLNANPDASVTFEGHTDSDGSDAHNQDLSARRAASVVGWLTGNGIAPGRLAGLGFGETMPVADNTTPAGKALNRRVEVLRN
jgi:outer membrane protein OmpA-like peptidoglycan-associated protein